MRPNLSEPGSAHTPLHPAALASVPYGVVLVRRERVWIAAVEVVAEGAHDARAQPLLQHATQAAPHALTYGRSTESEIESKGNFVCGSLRINRTGTGATSRGQARQSNHVAEVNPSSPLPPTSCLVNKWVLSLLACPRKFFRIYI